jgi:hypothetical protein
MSELSRGGKGWPGNRGGWSVRWRHVAGSLCEARRWPNRGARETSCQPLTTYPQPLPTFRQHAVNCQLGNQMKTNPGRTWWCRPNSRVGRAASALGQATDGKSPELRFERKENTKGWTSRPPTKNNANKKASSNEKSSRPVGDSATIRLS